MVMIMRFLPGELGQDDRDGGYFVRFVQSIHQERQYRKAKELPLLSVELEVEILRGYQYRQIDRLIAKESGLFVVSYSLKPTALKSGYCALGVVLEHGSLCIVCL